MVPPVYTDIHLVCNRKLVFSVGLKGCYLKNVFPTKKLNKKKNISRQ